MRNLLITVALLAAYATARGRETTDTATGLTAGTTQP